MKLINQVSKNSITNNILYEFTGLLIDNFHCEKKLIEKTLAFLGQNLNLDRLFFCENIYENNNSTVFKYKYEWISNDSNVQESLISQTVNWDGFEEFKNKLQYNIPFSADANNQNDSGLKTLIFFKSNNFLALPVFVDAIFYGSIVIDEKSKDRYCEYIDWPIVSSIVYNLGKSIGKIKKASLNINEGYVLKSNFNQYDTSFQKLKEKEIQLNKLNLIIENSPLGIALLDEEGVYYYMNKYHANIFGYQADELIGKKWTQLYEQPEVDNIINNYFPILGKQGFWSGETTGVKKNGELLVQDIVLTSLADGGLVCVTRDVTKIKKKLDEINILNDQLELAFTAANLGMWVYNKQDGIIKHNDILLKLIGYSSFEIENFSSNKWMSLIHPDDQASVAEALDKIYNNPDEIFRVEYRMSHKNGGCVWILGVGKMFVNSKNDVFPEITGFNIDITPLKEAEIELNKALIKEKELNTLKSKFLNIASHEFRTPLFIIRSSLELCDLLLEKEITSSNSNNIKKVQKKLGGLFFEVDKITDLMTDILTLGKSEAKKLNFNPINISFQSFVEDYFIKCNKNFIGNNPLNFNFDNKHRNVLIDTKLMTQVMENIMSNAIKYSPKNSPIDINIISETDYLQLEIRDYGIGICKSEIPFLFESFFRSKNATNIPGTGLGMSIVKLFVERNNGTVTVDSKLNYGTCFKITLPINKYN